MLYLVTIAGAIQLTRWVLALLDAIEKPSVLRRPKHDTEELEHQPPQGSRYSHCTSLPPIKQRGNYDLCLRTQRRRAAYHPRGSF